LKGENVPLKRKRGSHSLGFIGPLAYNEGGKGGTDGKSIEAKERVGKREEIPSAFREVLAELDG